MDFEDYEFRRIAAAPVEPLPNSQKKLNGGNSHSGLAPDYLLNRAELLFACYRKDEAHDPQTYSAAVAAVLGDGYSREVVEYVTDPRTGIPSKQKFLPAVVEVSAKPVTPALRILIGCGAINCSDRQNPMSQRQPNPVKSPTRNFWRRRPKVKPSQGQAAPSSRAGILPEGARMRLQRLRNRLRYLINALIYLGGLG